MVLRASSHSFKVCYNVPTCYDAWLIIYYLNLKHEQKLLDVNAIISHFYIILNSELQFCSKKKKTKPFIYKHRNETVFINALKIYFILEKIYRKNLNLFLLMFDVCTDFSYELRKFVQYHKTRIIMSLDLFKNKGIQQKLSLNL